jgi:hypothetical protein
MAAMFQKIALSLIPKIFPVPSVARRSSTRASAGWAANRVVIGIPAAAALAIMFCFWAAQTVTVLAREARAVAAVHEASERASKGGRYRSGCRPFGKVDHAP